MQQGQHVYSLTAFKLIFFYDSKRRPIVRMQLADWSFIELLKSRIKGAVCANSVLQDSCKTLTHFQVLLIDSWQLNIDHKKYLTCYVINTIHNLPKLHFDSRTPPAWSRSMNPEDAYWNIKRNVSNENTTRQSPENHILAVNAQMFFFQLCKLWKSLQTYVLFIQHLKCQHNLWRLIDTILMFTK